MGTDAALASRRAIWNLGRVNVEMKGQKIEAADIQTTNFSVRPKFQHFKDGKPPVDA